MCLKLKFECVAHRLFVKMSKWKLLVGSSPPSVVGFSEVGLFSAGFFSVLGQWVPLEYSFFIFSEKGKHRSRVTRNLFGK